MSSPILPAETEYAGAAASGGGWAPGDVILGLYEVIRTLGEGGMGVVHQVRHRGWNTHLAVKSPRATTVAAAGGLENFIRESETWVKLGTYPHIVSCFYVRLVDDVPRVFIEYVDGGTLHEAIVSRELYAGDDATRLERILDVAIQCARGLAYTHANGVVHKDVKPSNIMLDADGTAKVTDFGLAGAVGGTPAYVSPEHADVLARREPPHVLTPRADLWSWAIVVLEMFSGERPCPYGGQTAREALETYLRQGAGDDRIPAMPPRLAELLRQCLQWSPADRPARMEDAAAVLELAYEEELARPYGREKPAEIKSKADAFNNRAVSYLDLGRDTEALTLWQQALQEDPQHVEATFNSFHYRWEHCQTNDAAFLDRMRALESSNRSNPDYWHCMASLHVARGDDDAVAAIERSWPAALDEQLRAALAVDGRLRAEPLPVEIAWNFLRFAPDGAMLVRGPSLHELRTNREIARFPVEGKIIATLFSPDGRYLLLESEASVVSLCEVATAAKLWQIEGCRVPATRPNSGCGGFHTGCIAFEAWAAFSSDSRVLAFIDVDQSVALRSLPDLREIARLRGHASLVNCLRFSPDGRRVLTGGDDQLILVFDAASGAEVLRFGEHPFRVDEIQFSVDGRYVLSRHEDTRYLGTFRHILWELATGEAIARFDDLVAFSRRSSYVCGDRASFDIAARSEGPPELAHSSLAVQLSSDERQAFVCERAEVVVYDIAGHDIVRRFTGHTSEVYEVRLSPDDRFAFTRSRNERILWDALSGRALRVVPTDGNDIGFSPDGRYLLAGDLKIALPRPGVTMPPLWPVVSRVRPVATLTRDTTEIARRAAAARSCLAAGSWHDAHEHLRQAQTVAGYERDEEILALLSECASQAEWRPGGIRSYWRSFTIGHDAEPVSSVGFVPRSEEAVTVSDSGTMRFWDLATGRETRPHGEVAVQIAPDRMLDHYLVVGAGPEAVALLDMDTWVESARITTGLRQPVQISVSHDGRSIVCADERGIAWCDVSSGSVVRRFKAGAEKTISFCLSGDDAFLLVAGSRTARLFDVDAGQEIGRFAGHTGALRCAAISPDGSRVVTGGDDKTIRLWDTGSACELAGFELEWVPKWVSFLPDGQHVLWSDDFDVYVRDLERDGERGHCGEPLSGARPAVLSHDGQFVLTRTTRTASGVGLLVSEAATGRRVQRLTGHARHAVTACFSPDGAEILSAGEDDTVRRWDAATGRQLELWPRRAQDHAICHSPDGARVLWGGPRGVEIRDLSGGQRLRYFDQLDEIRAFAFSDDGRYVACAERAVMAIRDPRTRTRIAGVREKQPGETDLDRGDIKSIVFSHAGQLLAWTDGKTLGCHETTNWAETMRRVVTLRPDLPLRYRWHDFRQFTRGGDSRFWTRLWWERLWRDFHRWRDFRGAAHLHSLSFSPDDRLLLGCADRFVIVWRAGRRRWSEVARYDKHAPVHSAAFSPDGRLALSVGSDNAVRVWDSRSGIDVARFDLHPSTIAGAVFAFGGTHVMVAGSTGAQDLLQVWEVESGHEVARMEGELGGVTALALSPDARHALFLCRDRHVRLWNFDWEWAR